MKGVRKGTAKRGKILGLKYAGCAMRRRSEGLNLGAAKPPPDRLLVFKDIVDGVLDRLDLFRLLIGDFHVELFLESHDQLHQI